MARLRPVRDAEEREYVRDLLAAHDLPTDDLDGVDLFVREERGERVGCGGLEYHGKAVLLRSVAVDPAAGGEGHGTAIVEELLDRARDEGATRAYLLTTTAADFFRGLGFGAVERDALPEAIRGTAQFRDLCPASATCMERPFE